MKKTQNEQRSLTTVFKLTVMLLLIGAVVFIYFTYQTLAGTTQNVSLTSSVDLERGLVGHWSFDGKELRSNSVDRSTNGNTGYLSGFTSTTTVAGAIGQALDFDGNDDYITINAASSLDDISSTVTVAAWVKPRDTGNAGIFEKTVGGSTNTQFLLYGESGSWKFRIDDGGLQTTPAGGGAVIVADEWAHVTGTYDGVTLRLYINGEEQQTLSYVGDIDSGAGVSQIGELVTATTYDMDGAIDDVRVYNRVLSSEEITRLYKLGATSEIATTLTTRQSLETGLVGHWTFDGPELDQNAVDRSGSGHTGYLNGFTSTTTRGGRIGQALDFDGTDDYVDAGTASSIDDLSPITVALWVKPDNTDGQSVNYPVSKGIGNAAGAGWAFGINGTYTSGCDGGGANNVYLFTSGTFACSTTALSDDNWYYVAFTHSGGTTKVYVNGVEESSTSQTLASDASDTLNIGRRSNNTWYIDAVIDDVRIYNRALSHEEIDNLYNLGATTQVAKTLTSNPGLESGLLGHWTFDGPDMLQNVADTSGNANTGYLSGFTSTTTRGGRMGQALTFDGSDDVVEVPSAPINGATDLSASFWIHSANTSKQSVISGANSSNNNEYLIFMSDVQLDVYTGESGSSLARFDFTSLNDGNWHHIVVVRDQTNGGVNLYVDGTLDDESPEATTLNSLTVDSGGLVFGQEQDSVGGGYDPAQAFDGSADDVRLYSRVLSIAEVSELYRRGSPTHAGVSAAVSTDTGFIYPQTTGEDVVGHNDWANESNIKAADNVDASTGTLFGNNETYRLFGKQFNFNIPSTATIDGIEVEIEGARSTPDSTVPYDNHVRLYQGGTIGGTDLATQTDWTQTDVTRTYGGSTQLWGRTWAPSDLNNTTNFGVGYEAKQAYAAFNNNHFIDFIRVKVYYTWTP